jgi:hypothetical protein
MTYRNNSRNQRRADGMSNGLMAALVVAFIVIAGGMFMLFASDRTNTASGPSIGRDAPATTGQGSEPKAPAK